MLCQSCQKNTATTHIKSIVNGELTEYALCPDCSQKLGYGNLFHEITGFGFGNLLGGLFGTEPIAPQVVHCEACGATFEEISRSGKVGCAACYTTFRDRLLPSLQRIHGTARHQGKRPGTMAIQVVKKPEITVQPSANPLAEKKKDLQKAIEVQDFERAAVLRDEIRAMEEKE